MTFGHNMTFIFAMWVWVWGPQVTEPEKYFSEVQEWRKLNEEKLRAPFGWLSLTGHYWLQQGTNRMGPREDCEIQLPSDLSSEVNGLIVVEGERVILKTLDSSGIQVNGKWVSEYRLQIGSDKAETDGTDTITIGERLKLQLVRRAGRLAIRVRDQESLLRKDFRGKRWFEIQPAFCVEATFTPYEPEKSIRIVNIKGDTVDAMLAGALRFQLQGRELTLDAIAEEPDSLFLVFKDLSSGKSTYGPGRFLTLEKPEDGRVTLDFNRAYNPPCLFSPHTLCPLPPRQNHLDLEIVAGERLVEK